MSRVAVGGRNARVHTIVGGWRLHISRILYGCLGSIDLVSSKEQGVQLPDGRFIWALSSVGRAPALQAGGRGFDSHRVHHSPILDERGTQTKWSF